MITNAKFDQIEHDLWWEDWTREWINFLGIFLKFSGVIIHKEKRTTPYSLDVNSLYAHQISSGLRKGELNVIVAGVGVGKSRISNV